MSEDEPVDLNAEMAGRLRELADGFESGELHIATASSTQHLTEVAPSPDGAECWEANGLQTLEIVYADKAASAEAYRALAIEKGRLEAELATLRFEAATPTAGEARS